MRMATVIKLRLVYAGASVSACAILVHRERTHDSRVQLHVSVVLRLPKDSRTTTLDKCFFERSLVRAVAG